LTLIDRALVVSCLASCALTQPRGSRYNLHMPITEQEYRERKRELQGERAQLTRRLEMLNKRLESLDVIWSWLKEDQEQMLAPELIHSGSEPKSTLLEESTPIPNGTQDQFSLLNEVNNATREIGEEVVQPVITKLLQERFPDEDIQAASVSNRLTRLSKLGELEVVSKGSGSRPTIYRRAT
jgi:hypothetical protein